MSTEILSRARLNESTFYLVIFNFKKKLILCSRMNKRINSRRFDQLNDHFQENLFQKEESFEINKIEVQMYYNVKIRKSSIVKSRKSKKQNRREII